MDSNGQTNGTGPPGKTQIDIRPFLDDATPESCVNMPSVFELKPPSEEQKKVIDAVANGVSCVVSACAGSGKTSTSLLACETYVKSGRHCVLLTYNKALKLAVRCMVYQLGWQSQLEVHNYHALNKKYYYSQGDDDAAIEQGLKMALMLKPAPPLHVLVIDEAQDMKDLFCCLVNRFIDDCVKVHNVRPVILLLGDVFQQVYGYAGAQLDYMRYPEKHFNTQSGFQFFRLSISYRITHEMANFINENLNPTSLQYTDAKWYEEEKEFIEAFWGDGIHADPRREKQPDSVMLIDASGDKVLDEVVAPTIEQEAQFYGNEETIILSISVKKSKNPDRPTPLQRLVDILGRRGEPWHVQLGEEEWGPQEGVLRHKRRVSTIVSFKGMERRFIVVSGLDYFAETYEKRKQCAKKDPMKIYNVFYVAATRASSKLILLQHNRQPYATLRKAPCDAVPCCSGYELEVRKMLEYTPFHSKLSCCGVAGGVSQSKVELLRETLHDAAIPHAMILVPGKYTGTVEDTSAVIGVAVEFALLQELNMDFSVPLNDHVMKEKSLAAFVRSVGIVIQAEVINPKTGWPQLKEVELRVRPEPQLSLSQLLQLAIAKIVALTGYINMWRQISNSDSWANVETFRNIVHNSFVMLYRIAELHDNSNDDSNRETTPQTIESMKQFILKMGIECFCKVSFPTNTKAFPGIIGVIGEIDFVIAKRGIVELKVTSQNTQDHRLQAATYASMRREKQKGQPQKCYLMYPNKGELFEVGLVPDDGDGDGETQQQVDSIISADRLFLYRLIARKQFLAQEEQDAKVRQACEADRKAAAAAAEKCISVDDDTSGSVRPWQASIYEPTPSNEKTAPVVTVAEQPHVEPAAVAQCFRTSDQLDAFVEKRDALVAAGKVVGATTLFNRNFVAGTEDDPRCKRCGKYIAEHRPRHTTAEEEHSDFNPPLSQMKKGCRKRKRNSK